MKQLNPLLLLIAGCSLSAAQTLSPSSMLEDFDILRKAIQEAHGGLYRYADSVTINKLFTDERARLQSPRSKQEFIAAISTTLANLRDGHMRLEYDEQTNVQIAQARMLPLRLVAQGSKLFVLFNDTRDDQAIVPGMEIISVNGRPAEDLLTAMLSKVSGDGFIQTGKLFLLGRNFAMYYWLFTDQGEIFDIEARDPAGRVVKAVLEGVASADRSANRNANPVNASALKYVPQARSKNILVQFHDNNSIASISIRGFEGATFTEELDSVFRSVQQRKTTAVILDLRGNGGGVDTYGAYLVSQFTDKPFRYFDRIHLRDINPSFTTFRSQTLEDLKSETTADPKGGFLVTHGLHPGVGIQQPGKYPFKGKLIVLLNGGTFSTAADVTAVLHNMKRGVFVGEESGGGYDGNTSGTNARVILPNSKLSVKVQMYDYYNAVTSKVKGRGTIPDHGITNSISEVVRGTDAQLTEAFKLARQGR